MSKKSTQAIYRTVIRAGRYGRRLEYEREDFMCYALRLARDNHEITPEEYERAYGAIQSYLKGHSSVLRSALRNAGIIKKPVTLGEFAEGYGREFYWNWSKRPAL